MSRQCQLLIAQNLPENLPPDVLVVGESGVHFAKTVNLLGQEFAHILFDARQGIHLEALAIAAGTLKRGGTLCLLLADWANLACRPDQDSLRWSGKQQAIATPNFIRHFKQCVTRYGFPVLTAFNAVLFRQSDYSENVSRHATAAQQKIIEQILQKKHDLYFLTAKRGRGKSALLGILADQLNAPIFLTAANKNAVETLRNFAASDPQFIAPDELSARLRQDPAFSKNAWLFVDEAAMIPLVQLQGFARHFQHILFSTTIHSYEGTGRGFEVKFKQKIDRTFLSFELQQPLRWAENDPLELFIEDLLLLNAEEAFGRLDYAWQTDIHIHEISQSKLVKSPESFYGLMSLAHYRTSPIDLRRLLDGRKQRFCLAECDEKLLGAIWALEEGEIRDEYLLEQIRRGKRRPKGNLVPQALCFHENLPQACRLRSLRISRIAVAPHWQRQQIGRKLVDSIECRHTDFLSVSFGYTEQLARFWLQCGFILVHLGEHQDASSGCYSAIALKGLSAQGAELVRIAERQFRRNFPLSFHPLAANLASGETDWTLNETDWQSLKDFADFHRTLFSVQPAIRRLLNCFGERNFPHIFAYLTKKQLPFNKKKSVEYLRLEIKQFLLKNNKRILYD